MGRTHFALGANSVWFLFLLGPIGWPALWLAAIGGLAGLLPDIDTRKSGIHEVTGGLLRLFLLDILFRHRSITHSIIGFLLVVLLSSALATVDPVLPLIISLGYASHLLIDGTNPQGCEYLYPKKENYRLIPKILCVDTGGWMDNVIFTVSIIGLGLFAGIASGWIRLELVTG